MVFFLLQFQIQKGRGFACYAGRQTPFSVRCQHRRLKKTILTASPAPLSV
jgi:hypothetical protein